ncbi:hypothetical protein Droror1_Dr00025503 [Drosera rotundifolia]
MSTDCMYCQVLNRVDSDATMRFVNNAFCCKVLVERSWSGNLAPCPAPYHKKEDSSTRMIKKAAKDYKRTGSMGAVDFDEEIIEPKLVRSGGMRRDWSFECLEHMKMDRTRKTAKDKERR